MSELPFIQLIAQRDLIKMVLGTRKDCLDDLVKIMLLLEQDDENFLWYDKILYIGMDAHALSDLVNSYEY